MSLCGHNARPTVGVELNNQHTAVVSRQLHVVIGSEIVTLKRLHSILLSHLLVELIVALANRLRRNPLFSFLNSVTVSEGSVRIV
jgi:hypothetical protein